MASGMAGFGSASGAGAGLAATVMTKAVVMTARNEAFIVPVDPDDLSMRIRDVIVRECVTTVVNTLGGGPSYTQQPPASVH